MAAKKSKTATMPRVPPRPAVPVADFILYANPALALVCVPADAPARFSFEAAAALTGVHPDLLRYYCRLGVIERYDDGLAGEPTLDESALHEVRRLEHYRRHLGVCRRALPLLCALRREGERMHIKLHFLGAP